MPQGLHFIFILFEMGTKIIIFCLYKHIYIDSVNIYKHFFEIFLFNKTKDLLGITFSQRSCVLSENDF